TGFNTAERNVGEIWTKGLDVELNGRFKTEAVEWHTAVGLSIAKNTVAKFYGNPAANSQYVSNAGNTLNPVLDRSLYPVFSCRFAGLDPATGDPMGVYMGAHSVDYSRLLNDSLQNLVYHGTALPPYYGFWRGNVSWKGFDFSFSISYKFGHYFQKETINYYSLFNSWNGHADYALRWQNPGDERHTTVPSMVYPVSSNRENFYARSEANIERADLVRLQDIRLAYAFGIGKHGKRPIGLSCYLSANNVGLLWSATDSGIDPDYNGLPPQTTYSFGLNVNF